MKHLKTFFIALVIVSCSSNSNHNDSASDTAKVTYDVTKADTTLQPNGVTDGEAISTDTAALRPADSAKRNDSSR
jgi:hypothetical protein